MRDNKDSSIHVSLFSLLKPLGTKPCAGGSTQLLDGNDSIVNNGGDMRMFLINTPGKYPLASH